MTAVQGLQARDIQLAELAGRYEDSSSIPHRLDPAFEVVILEAGVLARRERESERARRTDLQEARKTSEELLRGGRQAVLLLGMPGDRACASSDEEWRKRAQIAEEDISFVLLWRQWPLTHGSWVQGY